MKPIIASLGALAALVPAVAGAAQQQKPNVVIILCDDLGWGDVSYHGSSNIKTPNIDRLASMGLEMNRFYVAPVSSPTRAGLMTGCYPSRFGIRETVLPPWREYGLDENQPTMANVLETCGYTQRSIIGKWHLGHSRKAYYPNNRGFNHFYGCLNGAIDYFTHERDGELDWHKDWESCWDKGYSTDLIAAEAVATINRSTQDPFFMYVAFNAPHSPIQAPEDEIALHVNMNEFAKMDKKKQNEYTYRAMVTRLDKGIGQILAALEKSGKMDDTFILFMSDNGGAPGTPGCSNLPLRGSKFYEWDGGVRVPAVIYWKNGGIAGGKSEQLTGFVDMLPTLADILSAPKPKTGLRWDGQSVYKVLTGKKQPFERIMYLGCGAAVTSRYKMVIAGKNPKMELNEDFFVDYSVSPYEAENSIGQNEKLARLLKKYITLYDNIVPTVKELPYDYGKEGFVSPPEWKVTKE